MARRIETLNALRICIAKHFSCTVDSVLQRLHQSAGRSVESAFLKQISAVPESDGAASSSFISINIEIVVDMNHGMKRSWQWES